MRIDKWLWAARFYKTRALAAEEIQKGRVQINNKPCKPAREIDCGDTISLRGWCEKPGAARIGFGECVGTVLPAKA